ncbi:MAG TPA: amidohydrolase [Verrucomicrobiales bacterium]|nr:amidohydrolase [Verrucomicrobiales bacterium]
MRFLLFGLSLALFFTVTSSSARDRTLIHCGKLVDVEAGEVRGEATIVVVSNRIEAVSSGHDRPRSGDRVVDLRNATVLPGLMDMHVHLQSFFGPERYVERFQLNPEDLALHAAHHARLTLRAGFTTVRDLGGEQVVALRNAIAKGIAEGPRIIAAGRSVAITGGHADQSNGMRRDLQGDPGPAEGVINGPDDARKAVRQRYKEGADVIKITATGGVLSVAKDGFRPQFTQAEVDAIVEAARDLGLSTAAHAHGPEGMKRAVLAGIGSIEHGTMMTEEVMDLMRERGTWYVPTLSAGRYTEEKAKVPGYYPAVVAQKALAVSPMMMGTFSQALKRGVKIAFGTDAGVFPHGENAKEFLYLVEGGMTPMAAIQSATVEAAKLLGQERELGAIKPGMLADIIAVEGDPVADVVALQKVVFVMKNGAVFAGP